MPTKNRTLFIWWLSYMAVLLFCFISGSFIYAHTLDAVEKEIRHTSNATVGRFINHLETRMAEMYSTVRTLAVSDRTTRLMKLTNTKFTAEEMENIYYCQKLLISSLNTNSEFQNMFIYYPAVHVLLSSQALYRDFYIDKAAAEYGLTLKALNEYSRTSGLRLFYPLKDGSLMLIQRYSGKGGGSMLIGLVLSSSDMIESVRAYMPENSLVLARFNDSTLRIGSLPVDDSQISKKIFDQPETDFISLKVDKLTAVVAKSSNTDVQYAYIIPTNEYYREIISLKWIFVAYAAALLLLGGILAWLLAKKNYRPIRQVANMLIARASMTADEDAIRLIERKVKDFIKESDENEKQQFKADKIFKNDLLLRLLTGRSMGLTENEFHSCGIDISGRVAVAALRIEDYGDLFSSDHNDYSTEEKVLLHAVKNVTEEFTGGICPSSTQIFDDVIYCISSLHDTNLTMLQDAIQRVLDFIVENLHVKLSAGISCEHRGMSSVREAAVEAFGTLEYLSLNKTIGTAGLFEKLANEQGLNVSQHGFFEKLSLITNLTLVGEFEAALSAISSAASYCHDVHTVRNRVQSIALVICEAVESLDIDNENAADAIIRELHLFAFVRTLKDLQSGSEKIYGMLIEQSIKRIETKEDKVITYIEEHYSDSSLSIGSIADHFEMSQSTLTRTVSRLTGRNPLDYIQFLRLNLAKERLADGTSVAQVAVQVGCYNELTLKRIFKKFEGITPAAYRQASRNQGSDKQ